MPQDRLHLPNIDQYVEDGIYTAPPSKDVQYDMSGFFKFLTEKYGGDSSKMTQEEKERFIVRLPGAQAV
jgi:hypothetical protein